ncbi:MAG: hypothetical protein WA252_02105 [Candidatus Sulfotelmatobacter sp.]
MCDYSIMALPNRLAVCGEELVTHKFEIGTMGLISSADGRKLMETATKPKTLREQIMSWLNPGPYPRCTAVCIPPGARLSLRDISSKLQKDLGLRSDIEEVTFTQSGAGMGFRDAIRFDSGREISLQRLSVGQRVRILSLSSMEESTPELEELLGY